MLKHFITGNAGFIDSHLVDRLMGEDSGVTVYDNLVLGRRKWTEHHLDKESFHTSSDRPLGFKDLERGDTGMRK